MVFYEQIAGTEGKNKEICWKAITVIQHKDDDNLGQGVSSECSRKCLELGDVLEKKRKIGQIKV